MRVAGDQPTARRTQNIARAKNRIAGGIGVNQTSGRIDEIHARTKPVERIDESRDFRGLELEHSADQHGAPDMRSDQPHLPTCLVIDHAVSLVAEHSEDG